MERLTPSLWTVCCGSITIPPKEIFDLLDITELLASLPFEPPKASVNRRVTDQDSCHLAHAQRITVPPRELMPSPW